MGLGWGRLLPLEGVGLQEVRASHGPPCTGKCLLPPPQDNRGSRGLWQQFKGPRAATAAEKEFNNEMAVVVPAWPCSTVGSAAAKAAV
ncbi:hypothetical protein UY3_04231 [Chelonia mydas]|uniref:Uncharacterized protein n=1 Tax=Chelonia mydas TaxID=8469 RepID=M7BKX4_CHEMY|nr:hypothetical protein UY3_04231 [Chelonia mydas]